MAWQRQVANPDKGEVITGAPLIVEEPGDHRCRRRRIRHSRLGRGDRSDHPEGSLAHLHRFRQRTNRVTKPGRMPTMLLRPAAVRRGSRAPTIPRPTPSSGASEIAGPDWDNRVSAGRQYLHGQFAGARRHHRQDQVALSSTRRTIPTTTTAWPRMCWPTCPHRTGHPKLALEADRNGFAYAIDRTGQLHLGPALRQEGHLDQEGWIRRPASRWNTTPTNLSSITTRR